MDIIFEVCRHAIFGSALIVLTIFSLMIIFEPVFVAYDFWRRR